MWLSLLKLLCLTVSVMLPRGARAVETQAQMFTSYANLLKLYFMEEECLSNVDIFLREELLKHKDEASVDAAHNLTAVRKLVEEAKQIHREVGLESGMKDYLFHPINVLHLSQRLHYRWQSAIDLIRNSKACKEWHMPQVISRLSNIEANLPSPEDMTSVAHNLITIQHTQGIPTGDILQGRVGEHVSLVPISPQDQFRIAKLAVEEDDYYYAAQWLKHLSKSPQLKEMSREKDGFNSTNVFGMLASAYFRINMMPEALRATEDLLKKDPQNMVARANKAYFEQRIDSGKDTSSGHPVRYGKDDVYRRNYEALCRGTRVKPNRLLCRLVPTWPRSRMSFYKMEELSKKPPIVAFHRVFSGPEAAVIVDWADVQYEKMATDSKDGFRTPQFTLAFSKVRAQSKTKKAQEEDEQRKAILVKIRRQLDSMPHMATQPYTSGEMEVRNFGHQGLYIKPKPDFEVHSMGGHTGTAIMFLNDVEMGGEIVFPTVNARVEPKVGTVVYYYPSMKKFHNVCPVAYGTEWLLFMSYFEKLKGNQCRPHEDVELL